MSIIGHAEAWDIGNFANPNYYFRWDNAEFQPALQGVGGHGGRQEAPGALREDAEDAGRRGARGVAVHAPAARGGQEGRHRHLEGPARSPPSTCPRSAGRSSRTRAGCGATSLRRVAASLAHPLLRLAASSSSVVRGAARRPRARSSWALEASAGGGGAGCGRPWGSTGRSPCSTLEWIGPGRAGRSRPVHPVRRAGGRPHPVAHQRDPAADPAGRRAHGRDGGSRRGLRGHPAPALGRLPRDDAVPARRRRARVLGRAAPGPALLGEARLGAVGRLRRLGPGLLARAPLADPARGGAGVLPVRGARAHDALGRARGAPGGVREDGARQGRGGAAACSSATRSGTR